MVCFMEILRREGAQLQVSYPYHVYGYPGQISVRLIQDFPNFGFEYYPTSGAKQSADAEMQSCILSMAFGRKGTKYLLLVTSDKDFVHTIIILKKALNVTIILVYDPYKLDTEKTLLKVVDCAYIWEKLLLGEYGF